METPTLQTKTATAVKQPVNNVVEQKYRLVVNERPEGYNPLPKQIRDDRGRIASQFQTIDGIATTAILRGLSTEQERYFASKLINKNPKDLGYDEAMTIFWAEYSVDVPKQGLNLDASYEIKDVMLDGERIKLEVPLYLDQYIKATYAKGANVVAFTEEERANPYLYNFIMTDLSIEKRKQVERFKIQNKADELYVDLVKSYNAEKPNEKIDHLLDCLKEPHEHFYSATPEDKLMRLKQLAASKAEDFIKLYEDASLEIKSLIFRLVQTRLLTVEGSIYFNGDISLGDYKSTIAWFSDQTKSGEVAKLKSRLNEVLKLKK